MNEIERSYIMEENKIYHFRKGSEYLINGEYEKAIEDFTKVIEIDKNCKDAYLGRGSAYGKLEKYEKTIEDFTKVIEIDKNLKKVYCARGDAYGILKEHEKAIEDFTKVIEIDKNYKDAYWGRGLGYNALKDYKKAIEDYTRLIELDKNFEYKEAYFNRGGIYINLKEYEKAIEDFNQFIDLDEKNNNNDNNILSNMKFEDNVLYFIPSILIECKWDLDKEEKKLLVKLIINSYELMEICRVEKTGKLLHYTKASTLKFLLQNKKDTEKDENGESIFPKLRLNNAVYMNDPSEGKIFNDLSINNNIKRIISSNNEYYTYLTCFCSGEEKDKLPMWIHYGDRGNGICIVFREEFFKDTSLYKIQYLDPKNFKVNKIYKTDDKKTKAIKRELNEILKTLGKNKIKNSKNTMFLEITNIILNYVSYLFKDKAYSYEEEVRIIKLRDYNEAKIDKQYDVPKLYIDFERPITSDMIDEIIVGPKGDFEAISAYAKYVGIKKVSKSKIKYR